MSMTRPELVEMMTETFAHLKHLNEVKGNDYTQGSNDAFANFKRNAQRLDLPAEKVWAVYFFKHIDSIETYLKKGSVMSEPILGRIDDAIMYLLLLRGEIISNQSTMTSGVIQVDPEEDTSSSSIPAVPKPPIRPRAAGAESPKIACPHCGKMWPNCECKTPAAHAPMVTAPNTVKPLVQPKKGSKLLDTLCRTCGHNQRQHDDGSGCRHDLNGDDLLSDVEFCPCKEFVA